MSTSTSQPPASAPATESRWSRWGKAGVGHGLKLSDWASTYANGVSAKIGGERFWPSSNDMPLELEKCERILRAFTVEGIPQKEEKEEEVRDGKGGWVRKKRKVLKKIPPAAIKRAKGICIYSSMRSGIAPFGGAGGSGIVMARLPSGQWSAPSAVSPNNLAAGLLLGIDFYDVVLLINSDAAMDSFKTHKFTISAETAIAAGPVGAGTSAEAGLERAPIFSYVRSRGLYAGVEMTGQVFIDRFDENERFYYWPGIKAGDILSGKVRMPPLAAPLHRALRDAEMGIAQGGQLDKVVYDIVQIPESEVMKRLAPNAPAAKRRIAPASAPATLGTFAEGSAVDGGASTSSSSNATPESTQDTELLVDEEEEDFVREGERLKLPPTPQELEMLEVAGIPDEEDLKWEQQEREAAYKTLPPPMHPRIVAHWKKHPTLGAKRRTTQLEMGGPYSLAQRQAQYVPLPPSPPVKAVGDDTAPQLPLGDIKQSIEEDEQTDFLGAEYPREKEVAHDESSDTMVPVPAYEAGPSDGPAALAALQGEKERELDAALPREDLAKPLGEVKDLQQEQEEQDERVLGENLNEEEAHKLLRDLALPGSSEAAEPFGDVAAPTTAAGTSDSKTEEITRTTSGLTLAPAAHIDEKSSSSSTVAAAAPPAALAKEAEAAVRSEVKVDDVEEPAPAYEEPVALADLTPEPIAVEAEAEAPVAAPLEELTPEPIAADKAIAVLEEPTVATAPSPPIATSPLPASGSSATVASHARTHSISEASSAGGDNFDSAEQSPNPEYADLANSTELMDVPTFNGLDSGKAAEVVDAETGVEEAAKPAEESNKEEKAAAPEIPALLEPVTLLEPTDRRSSTATEPGTPTALSPGGTIGGGGGEDQAAASPISRSASPISAAVVGAVTPLATPPARPPKNRPPRSAARSRAAAGAGAGAAAAGSENATPVAGSPATPAAVVKTPEGTAGSGGRRKGRKPPPTE